MLNQINVFLSALLIVGLKVMFPRIRSVLGSKLGKIWLSNVKTELKYLLNASACSASLVLRDPLSNNNNNNNNTAGDAPYVNENILSNMKKSNRRRGLILWHLYQSCYKTSC